MTLLNCCADLVQIIRDLRKEDDISTRCNTGAQCQPADLMSHDFNDKDAAVGGSCRVDLVDCCRRDIDCRLIAECKVRPPDIVVNGLRKMNDIESFLAKKVCGLLCSVSAENYDAVKAKLIVILLHGSDFIKAVGIRNSHQLERLSRGTDDRAAACEDAGEIVGCEQAVISIDHTLVALDETVDLNILEIIRQALDNTAHCRVESLAVTSAG